ncbi:DNA binding protein [Novosphingobium terrae]|uniref:EcoRII N-terminal effector-binding domain-containing protein n=1 Tax=Novosphingobium terrae TaxID=2726189 RepID=UPI00197D5FD6|nr:EcoRII N-terminal effector-binding domain-containing protein [Novosphingobium terrae]
MIDQEFEGPFFKRLSHNDSGAAKGKQAGFVIPKPSREFFPPLPEPTDDQPAHHVTIRAILNLDGRHHPTCIQSEASWQKRTIPLVI